ncbi:MAG: hypothetical protein E7324_01425 [Clostridiales bacterium]|nr:hypothetical protein [Clostridiales bacterium]
MKCLIPVKLWLHHKIHAKHPEKRRFCASYVNIFHVFLALGVPSPLQLSKAYMMRILKEKDEDWWQQNNGSLDQPWFIRKYCLENGLMPAPAEEEISSAPEGHFLAPGRNADTFIPLRLERNTEYPQQGRIIAGPGPDTRAFTDIMEQLGFLPEEEGYSRVIDKYSGPLFDRGTETGCRLLEMGYGVFTAEAALGKAILSGKYTPEKTCWVLPDQEAEWLMLRCPANAAAYPYLLQGGGLRAPGGVRFPLSRASRLQDILKNTPFHVDPEAQQRLDMWQKAALHASIYQPRRHKQHPPTATATDIFQTLLHSTPAVPLDLTDDEP